ncbi:hypothetical protein B484DRAFT_456390 [Ochromonadaceae sp. CCMP2298]|nr:hypothetical protein B484DRAFT_456390 [Ochromonadaceae sp. CCMP2298]|eukprot:CAMPEP_0173175780 /NCGR_PEP_ID=MMETSP1141-20130122/4097_1 /TAXON_ID=483371 /ORGANISM="non described non described, Strain CCMP2298" /LENGTH=154 /DNA_ID=CAMNT_0014098051 /DNA_START=43 /DNA_END=507 /DNA_ORIENTATION=-
MSRDYDHGKNAYAKEHRDADKERNAQHTKHYIGNEMLSHYGVKPEDYAKVSASNYRMGSSESNGRDTKIDNALIGEHFSDTRHSNKGGYDAGKLAKNGVNREQQLQGLGNRFDVAKKAYAETGNDKFYEIAEDIKETAGTHLNPDMREWRLPPK